MQSKGETFDGFTFKFFSTFQLKKNPSIYCSFDQNKKKLFNFTPLLCAKQNKQYYAHWLKNKPVESVIASRTYNRLSTLLEFIDRNS